MHQVEFVEGVIPDHEFLGVPLDVEIACDHPVVSIELVAWENQGGPRI